MRRGSLIGTRGNPPDRDSIEQRIDMLSGKTDDRWVTDPTGFWMLYIGPLGGMNLTGAEANTDNNPIFDFVAGRSGFTERRRFGANRWLEMADEIIQAGIVADPLFPDRPVAAVLAGQLYAQADALHMRERQQGWKSQSAELRVLLRKLRKAVPPALLEPPDPTVADVLP